MTFDPSRAPSIQRGCLDDLALLLTRAAPTSIHWAAPGVTAAVVPSCPDNPQPNLVHATSERELLAACDRLAAAYTTAGVRAWEVLLDSGTGSSALSAAGYTQTETLAAMVADLSTATPQDPGDLDWTAEGDFDAWAEINELAYSGAALSDAFVQWPSGLDFRVYEARDDEGHPACVLATIDHPHEEGADLGIQFVATPPGARKRGLASRLVSAAMIDARERGCVTASGQSTAMGEPVYLKLGFRTYGHFDVFQHTTG